MKSNISIIGAKLAKKASQTIGKGGSNIPGVVARKIDIHILKKLSSQVKDIILVTGTNGKTTTSNLLANILRESGKKVIHNTEGANLITGITASFINHSSITGKVIADIAVIEVDEATTVKVLKEITPKAIIINNFFRDQLDRFGEIDILIKKIEDAIKPVDTTLILNADDPFVVRFKKLKKESLFFGLNKNAYQFTQSEMSESKFCPNCGEQLTYEHIHYGQLGYFSCMCGFKRPKLDYEVKEINKDLSFVVEDYTYQMNINGIYNIYNALGSIACSRFLGISKSNIKKGILSYYSENGRMQRFTIDNCVHILNLVKNPMGFNISLSEILSNEEDKQVVVYLNDLDLDSRDVSWIYDADFEKINREDVKEIICSGRRAYDIALRMKYAGIKEETITVIEDKEKAIDYSIKTKIKTFHLPTYTALEPVRKILEKK